MTDIVILVGVLVVWVAVIIGGSKLGAWVDRQEARENARQLDWRIRHELRAMHKRRDLARKVRTTVPTGDRWRLN